jgi:CheY-like chemotaxis protein
LYISKYLVELMGGAMYVESQIGSGSTFIFTFQVEKYSALEDDMTRLLLDRDCMDKRCDTAVKSLHPTGTSSSSAVSRPHRPIMSRRVSDSCVPPSSASSLMSPTLMASDGTSTRQHHLQVRHVLVVDDNPIILGTIERVLESATYLSLSISTACNGYDAISKLIAFYTSNSPVDLVLMDLDMPFMNGLKAAGEIRRLDNHRPERGRLAEERRLADTPIIGLTGDIREERFAEARHNGMDECIKKPVVKATLLEVMDRVGQRLQNITSSISGHARTATATISAR